MAAGLINVALLIYLIVKKRKKGLIFILSFGAVQAIAYLPWIMKLFTQMSHVSGGFWIELTFPKLYMEIISSQLAGYIRTTDYRELLVPTVFALELYGYIICKAYKYIKDKQNIKPFLWSAGIYLAVIVSALIITKVLNSEILYYRYLFVITGLYIFAISFIFAREKNKVYFYNEENWGVEEAYRAFEPNYSTEITKDFLKECSSRIGVVDETRGNAVQKFFKNTKYEKVSEKELYTEYHDYSYRIILLEQIS